MNNWLQIPWVEPCQEITPIPNFTDKASLQLIKQQVKCAIKNLDDLFCSLNSKVSNSENTSRQFISREILR